MAGAKKEKKHTLTSAVRAAEEAEESGDYYVGSFFGDDPETPSKAVYIPVTYEYGTAQITRPPESEAKIVLKIGDTADWGKPPDLLEMGETYREIESASWGDFVEELAERGVVIDSLWAEDEHPMRQGTLYIAVPSGEEEKKAITCARNLVEELGGSAQDTASSFSEQMDTPTH